MVNRVRYLFRGTVQGVGFRPFIYRIATQLALSGFAQNTPGGVMVEVEGPGDLVGRFMERVVKQLPPLADIADMTETEIPVRGDTGFSILPSTAQGRPDVHITPDTATCPACYNELFDPKNRRYRYPFVNCTNCGPRLTIVRTIPYDRVNTSMACFALCPRCKKEYEDPSDRRFHAEPNACPECGPQLTLLDKNGMALCSGDRALVRALEQLQSGSILAIKGIGGFHLCVDATHDAAVRRLRLNKFREEKPFAIMVRDVEQASRTAAVNVHEKGLLADPQRPIVLLKKKHNGALSPAVAPGMPCLGIMLPYSPLHHLLLAEGFEALVMTSGNQTDEPICIGNREAVRRLAGIADFFLVHNRDILVRCDDSIAMVAGNETRLLRRSRGFVPKPVTLKDHYPAVLALGPHLKATLCILKQNTAFLSPHIGDMETPEARRFFHESLGVIQHITECRPDVIACDLHPGYYSTHAAERLGAKEIIRVQHHHAHIVSCMAENRISGRLIGLSMDGTGYGPDGHIWGGEFLVADESTFNRAGQLAYFLLPGGEKAIREPWRIGVSLLRHAYARGWKEIAHRLALVPQAHFYEPLEKMMERGVNCFTTSSLGRLFDGIASILGVRQSVSFEGQAAMELEGCAAGQTDLELPFTIQTRNETFLLDFAPTVKALVDLRIKGHCREELACAFHRMLARAFTGMTERISRHTGLNRVALSGGCFQNRILLEGCINQLSESGFEVFSHSLVPTNDGGISLGQAVCAGALLKSTAGRGNGKAAEDM